jgi:hypothetical protein
MHVALECVTIDRERQPFIERQRAVRVAEQAPGQRYGLANAAPESKMERPNQRDAHYAGPRNAACDPA